MSIAYYNIMNIDYSMINKKIGLKLKIERIKRNISQEELAFQAGVNKNTIWKIETGKVSPTIETLIKIANALEIDFTTLTDISKVDL